MADAITSPYPPESTPGVTPASGNVAVTVPLAGSVDDLVQREIVSLDRRLLLLEANSMVLGRTAVSVAGAADVTLTEAQCRNVVLYLTGILTGGIDVILPTIDGAVWIVNNATTGVFTLGVRTVAGIGPTVVQGSVMIVYCDGTDIVQAAEVP